MKRLTVLLLVAMFLPFSSAISDPPEQAPPQQAPNHEASSKLTPLMRMKLDKSKDILEGLTVENFDLIASSARSLKLLSMESGWNVLQTEEYAGQSRDFRRTCDLIEKAALDKDMGRAALGYVAMTVRCVECHSYMRKQAAENKIPPQSGHAPSTHDRQ